jgi:hypothetical protein
MSEINLPPFYVGQKVVAVKDTISLKKGKEYVILDIKAAYCKCGWHVDIGLPLRYPNSKTFKCGKCNAEGVLPPDAFGKEWINYHLFAPVQENFQSISFEKVIEKETPLICVN